MAAWNIERGRHLDRWCGHEAIRAADLLLLSEVDQGMARSGNLHVAREMAERLGLAWAWGPAFREHTHGNQLERWLYGSSPNAEGLHGVAILSRLPIEDAWVAELPDQHDWASDFERKEGRRVALYVRLAHATGPLTAVCTHLENRTGPQGRALQFRALLAALPPGRCIVGGDFNCTTIDLGRWGPVLRLPFGMLRNPSRLIDPTSLETLFADARAAGLEYAESNVARAGTGVPPWLPMLPRLLRPKVDWILTRDLASAPGTAAVYPCPRTWERLSEHEGVGVTLQLVRPHPA